MNQHEIKNFLAAAEFLHFGRASEACHLSASALTRSIQRLEAELGCELFIRDNRSVKLSSEGEIFREYAQRTLRDWYVIQGKLLSKNEISGMVSIYASVTAVYSVLPDILESYRSSYPEVRIELRTGTAEEAIEKVVAGEIDVAVAALPNRQLESIEFKPLTVTQLVFVRPKGEAFAGESFADLSQTPLVLPRSGLSRERVNHWLKSEGLKPRKITEVSGNEGILAMVRLGCGTGVVPELVLQRSPFRDAVEIVDNAPVLDPYVVGLCSTPRNLRRSSVAALWERAGELKHGQNLPQVM